MVLFSTERPTNDIPHSANSGIDVPSTTSNKVDTEGDEEDSTRQVVFIEPGNEQESISNDLWEEIEGAQPPKWLVMKEVCGIPTDSCSR